jgi:hypothetical protein
MGTIQDMAHTLRIGLIGGYVSITDVVAWADALIGENRGEVVPQLFDLALLRSTDLARAVSLLGEVPGEIDRSAVGREIASLLHRGLVSGTLTEREAARALFTAIHEGYSPDDEFESMAYYFDDGVDLALRGVYGNLADLRTEMVEYLCRASLPKGSA